MAQGDEAVSSDGDKRIRDESECFVVLLDQSVDRRLE
jgi:hypothetical protein